MGIFDTKTTSKPNVPSYIKDFQKDVFKDIKHDWYNTDKPYSFTEPTFAGFSDQTKTAFGGLTDLAGANSGGNGMAPHLQSIMNNGGFTTGQRGQIDNMSELERNPYFDQTINGDGLSADQRLVADRYRSGMNEEFGLDPAYLKVKQNSLDQQRMALEAQAAKAGRYGGGSSQSILAREQGNLNANMDVGEMDKWRANTDADAAALANLSQTGFGNRSNAVTQRAGLEGQIFNAEQAGLGNMSQAYDVAQKPLQTMRAVGAEQEAQAQNLINDKYRMWQESDPRNKYRDALSFVNGMPMGQTTTASPSLGQTILGGGLATLGLGSAIAGLGKGTPAPGGYTAGSWG